MNSGRITEEQAITYTLFQSHELGYKWINHMITRTFVEQGDPHEPGYSKDLVTYFDGRRSIIREIMHMVDKVQEIIDLEGIQIDS